MRTLFIILLQVLCCSLAAQNPLEKIVDYRVKNALVADAIYELSDVAAVTIAFSNSILPADKTVTIRAKRKTVRNVLVEILEGTAVSFVLAENKRILLVEKPQPPPLRRVTISGYLLDSESGEPLIGAAIQDTISQKGTFSNAYGFYSLTLNAGLANLKISYLGYQTLRQKLSLNSSRSVQFELEPAITLAQVVVYATDESDYDKPLKIGTQKLRLKNIKSAPGIGGENDILKQAHQAPGVETGADGFGGFTVRGGNVDQNLILLDGVPVYNSVHALGLYSIFNSNTVRSTTMLRGVFPARYGGRISSVLDVRTKEGNNRKLSGGAEFGPFSGSVILEGPLKKEKSSFLLSYRRSFIDFYLNSPFVKEKIRGVGASAGDLSYYFYDVNAKVNFQAGKNDKIYFSFYGGQDVFEDESMTTNRLNFLAPSPGVKDSITTITFEQDQDWGNIIASARWNHTYTDKIFSNATLTYTRFFFQNIEPRTQQIFVDDVQIDSLFNVSRFNSNNQDFAAKIDFDYHPSSEHHILFGAAATLHSFQPRIIQFEGNIPVDTFNRVVEGRVDRQALGSNEYDIYLEDEWQPNARLKINPGLRFSLIQTSGKLYRAWQPRFLMSYELHPNFFFSAAAGYVVQPVHLLTTTGRGRAEDLWVSATSRFKPIESSQWSVGLSYHPGDYWILSVEGYLKNMKNIISFQEGFVQNIDASSWQNAAVVGRGDSRGLEFSARKSRGAFTMALNYTLASTTREFEDRNAGLPYRDQFDRRHNFNVTMNQELGKRTNLTCSFIYQSGALTTVPQASYLFSIPSLLFPFRGNVLVYEGRSNVSLPPYHRMDIGLNMNFADKPVKHLLKFGIYNLYNRQNPSFYNISNDCESPGTCYKQLTLVPIMPYFRYHIRF